MRNSEMVIDNTLEPRKLRLTNSLQWLHAALNQFKAFPFIWITLMLIDIGIIFILMLHPLFNIVSFLLMPIINAGLLIAAATGEQGICPQVALLARPFKTDALKLMKAGAFWGAISIILSFLFQQIIFSSLLQGIVQTDLLTAEQLFAYLYQQPISTYILLAGLSWLFIYFNILYSLVPGLIIFNRLTPLAAYRFAFSAGLRNWQPIMLYMLIVTCLGIAATLPFFLGWIVLGPILLIANFYLWRDLFTLPIATKSVIEGRVE